MHLSRWVGDGQGERWEKEVMKTGCKAVVAVVAVERYTAVVVVVEVEGYQGGRPASEDR